MASTASTGWAQVPPGYFTDVTKVLDAAFTDFNPFVSADGLSLYYNVVTEDPNDEDAWLATRSDMNEPFGNPVPLTSLNSPYKDHVGSVSSDGQTIYMASNRTGNWDIFQSDQAGNLQNLGPPLNSDLSEWAPRVSQDDKTIVFTRNENEPTGVARDVQVWMATRNSTDERFGNAQRLAMNTGYDDEFPSLSSDGLFLFTSDWVFSNPRPGGLGGADIWVSMRPSTDSPFELPVNLNELFPGSTVNSSFDEGSAFISPDWPDAGSRIYWIANGPGTVNGWSDVFQATWVGPKPPLPIQIVVPSEFADQEAPSYADNLPPSYRLQQVYAAEEFASLPLGKQLITRARWRTDGNLDVPRTVSADQWLAHLSTTPKGVVELDQQFAANVGDDETVVYDGPVSWQIIDAAPAGGPRDFEFDLAFQKAFAYDPRQGNLLLDLSIMGGSEKLGLDFIVDATETTAFIWTGWTGNAEMDHADGTTVGGHVVEYTFVSPDCNSDGVIDVPDANCATVQTLDAILAVAGLIVGDADGLDGVDFKDFVILADHFGAPGIYTEGDFDLDGTVQFGDFVVLANNFGQSAAAAANVPEPATAILGILSVGGLLALRRRRRHIN